MIDLREIAESLTRHPLRTGITVLSVAWGTFVLVVLLGAGQGLQNNVRWEFRDDATNSLWVYPGKVSRPWQGQAIGRRVALTNRDHAAVAQEVAAVEHLSSRYYPGREGIVRYRDRAASFGLRAVHPDHQHLEKTLMVSGRFVDDLDVERLHKVVVIGDEVSSFLFRGEDPIGAWVDVSGVPFRVVGVFQDEGDEGEVRQVYLPISTAQLAFGGGEDVNQILMTVGDATVEEALGIEADLRALLAARHHFDPADSQAVRVRNSVERFDQVNRVFRMLDAFVWLVGLGTIGAGIVGVSNILLVSVRERTAEIGLRKALGATPARIVASVLSEAVVLTSVSGYLGIVAGVAVVVLLRSSLPENDYLRDPEVRLGPALGAAVLLVVFGAIAGFFPAWRAASVHPVEALRDA